MPSGNILYRILRLILPPVSLWKEPEGYENSDGKEQGQEKAEVCESFTITTMNNIRILSIIPGTIRPLFFSRSKNYSRKAAKIAKFLFDMFPVFTRIFPVRYLIIKDSKAFSFLPLRSSRLCESPFFFPASGKIIFPELLRGYSK